MKYMHEIHSSKVTKFLEIDDILYNEYWTICNDCANRDANDMIPADTMDWTFNEMQYGPDAVLPSGTRIYSKDFSVHRMLDFELFQTEILEKFMYVLDEPQKVSHAIHAMFSAYHEKCSELGSNARYFYVEMIQDSVDQPGDIEILMGT